MSQDKLIEKYTNSLLLSAVGDSLGWPLEFDKISSKQEVRIFQEWTKNIGGKYWSHKETIHQGEYSDDTQLTLSIARAIDYKGDFIPEHFSYLELPLWISYERGGGKASKLAARNLLKLKTPWNANFFKKKEKTKEVNYFDAGGNGALMRNLPISLANKDKLNKLLTDSFKNAIITHGHSRAIIGTLATAIIQHYLLNTTIINFNEFGKNLSEQLKDSLNIIKKDNELVKWLDKQSEHFEKEYNDTIEELLVYLRAIPKYMKLDDRQYYIFTNAFHPASKGSGTITVAVAVFLFFKYLDNSEESIFKAVNMIGSDTDTIASVVGSLVGLYKGNDLTDEVKLLISKVQDKNYITEIGESLFQLNIKEDKPKFKVIHSNDLLTKKDCILKIMAWEIGLHEMFWDALSEGDFVIHPTMGKGQIKEKLEQEIIDRDNYIAKIIKIAFNTGQTVYFRSNVKSDFTEVSESLSKYVLKDLKDNKFTLASF